MVASEIEIQIRVCRFSFVQSGSDVEELTKPFWMKDFKGFKDRVGYYSCPTVKNLYKAGSSGRAADRWRGSVRTSCFVGYANTTVDYLM